MLTSEFKEFAVLLNANRVEYLIVGEGHQGCSLALVSSSGAWVCLMKICAHQMPTS